MFFHEATAASIYQFLGDIPIILCLRNPVDRAFSAYNNLIRDQREFLTFDDALKAENSRFDDNWDWMWAYKRGGLYYEQVKSYKKQFSKIEIILFDDFETNPSLVVKNVFSFLGVDPEVTVATGSRYSHSGRPNNRLLAFFASRSNPIIFLFRKLLLLIFPRSLIEKIAARSLTKNEIDPNTREELNVFFRDDIEKLESLLNISLDRWK